MVKREGLLLSVECQVLTATCEGSTKSENHHLVTIVVKTGYGKNHQWMLSL